MPTYRVTYLVVPGCRRLMEDVEADALRREATTVVLLRDVLVVNRPRQVVALRVLRREVRQVEPHCPGGAVPRAVCRSSGGPSTRIGCHGPGGRGEDDQR